MFHYIIAFILIVHGLGHVMGFLESWTTIPAGFSDRPWLLPGNITIESGVGRAFGLLWLIALAGFVGAGLGLLFSQSWWPALAAASAAISLVVILPWWPTVTPGSRLGATLIDLFIFIWLAFWNLPGGH
jgi:hypothetical protein